MNKSNFKNYRDDLVKKLKQKRLKGKDILFRTGKQLAINLLEKESKTDIYSASKIIHQQDNKINKITKEKNKTIEEKDTVILQKNSEIEKMNLTEKIAGGELTMEQILETISNSESRTDQDGSLKEYYREQLIKKIVNDIESGNYKYLLSNIDIDSANVLKIGSINDFNQLKDIENEQEKRRFSNELWDEKRQIEGRFIKLSPNVLGEDNFRKLYTEACRYNEKELIKGQSLYQSTYLEKEYAKELYARLLENDKDQAYYFAEHNDIGVDTLAENQKKQQVIGSGRIGIEEGSTEKTNEILKEMYEKAEKIIDKVLMKNALDGNPLNISMKTFGELKDKGLNQSELLKLIPLLKKEFAEEYPNNEEFFAGFNKDNIIISHSISTAYDFDINRFIMEYLRICTLGLEDNFVAGYTSCGECGYKGMAVGQFMNGLNLKNIVVTSCGRDEWAKNIKPELKNLVEEKLSQK